MRQVVAYDSLALDGVAEAPQDFVVAWDDVMQANLADVFASQVAVICAW